MGANLADPGGEHELYTNDEGGCGQLRLYTFNSSNSRDKCLKAAQQFGGAYLVGDRWVIAVDDPSLLDSAQRKVGGERH